MVHTQTDITGNVTKSRSVDCFNRTQECSIKVYWFFNLSGRRHNYAEDTYVTRPAKINHVTAKNYHLFLLIIFYTKTSQSLTLMQDLIYNSQKWNTTFRTEDISKNITWSNLHSHGWLLQARSCMGHPEPLLTMPSVGSLKWFDEIKLLLTKQQINQNFEVLGIINLLNHWAAF